MARTYTEVICTRGHMTKVVKVNVSYFFVMGVRANGENFAQQLPREMGRRVDGRRKKGRKM